MKLAIICEMPKWEAHTVKERERGVRTRDARPREEDLSASAEQSAKDAFAYCPGPFSEMEFVRETNNSIPEGVDTSLAADWSLFMSHDCLVDVQAFEHFPAISTDCAKVWFTRWTSSGPSPESSEFVFAKHGDLNWPGDSRIINKRILIEPEPVEIGRDTITVKRSGMYKIDIGGRA